MMHLKMQENIVLILRVHLLLKNSGHWVQQEKPNEVNKIIGNFLKQLD